MLAKLELLSVLCKVTGLHSSLRAMCHSYMIQNNVAKPLGIFKKVCLCVCFFFFLPKTVLRDMIQDPLSYSFVTVLLSFFPLSALQYHQAQCRGGNHHVLHAPQQQALPHHLRSCAGTAEGLCCPRQVSSKM